MTEAERGLNRSSRNVFNDPAYILGLEIGDAYMANDAFVAQFAKRGQRLVANLLQSPRKTGLELDVVHIDEVDMIDIETLHRFIYALLCTLSRIVPCVDSILAVASYLGRKVILASRYLLEGLAKHRLSLIVAIIWTHVDEVHAQFNSSKNCLKGISFLDTMEHTSQRRSSKTELRDLHTGLADFVVVHTLIISINK